jgi:ATP diphosphatase
VTVPAGAAFDDALLGQELVSLKRIVDILRVECPWDREQTPRDIIGYTVEEVYELADAVADDDLAAEHGELGDLLLQVVLLALMLSERGAGDLAGVAADIETKLIRRHPHIFADGTASTPGEVKSRWERIKVEQEGREGIFHDVPASFPAMLQARKLQQRASSVGFDWSSAAEAFPKIAEEHAELAELFAAAAAAPPARDPDRHDPRVSHEVGDLLFATVNVARLLHIDPELALREASRRFERRVTAAAGLAAAEGSDWSGLDLPLQEEYYQRAKAAETAAASSQE